MIERKITIDPKSEIFRWGPVPGKFIYTSHFVVVNFRYFCKKWGGQWPKTLFLFKNNRMVWINEYPSLRSMGRQVFKNWMLPVKKRKRVWTDWQKALRELISLEKDIDILNLKKLNNQELLKLWQEITQKYINFWVPSTVPELGNYGADFWLKERLKIYIKSEQELLDALEILTALTKPSFYQEEIIDLCRAKSLEEHQKKYFWLRNSYAGVKTLSLDYFRKRRKQIKNPKREIKRIKRNLALAKLRKSRLAKRLKLDQLTIKIAWSISEGMVWQDQRKKYIFITIYYLHQILKEIGKRFRYASYDLEYLWPKEIEEIIKGKNFKKIIKQRKKGFGVHFYKSVRNLNPKEVKKYWKSFQEKPIFKKIKVIQGLPVSKGIAKGKIRILMDPFKISKFKKGEILVAPMTSPEYIFVMQKAKAVITDAGGLTCHAAIVSRELKIPCVVGTKIATKVLKDGDKVKVDANKGIIRKIK